MEEKEKNVVDDKLVDKYLKKRERNKQYLRKSKVKHQRNPYKSLDLENKRETSKGNYYDEGPEEGGDHESNRWKFKIVLAEDLEKRQQEKKAEKMQKKQEQQEWERLNSRFESESKRHFRNRMKQEMQKELIKEVKKVKKTQTKKKEFFQKRQEKKEEKNQERLKKKEDEFEAILEHTNVGLVEQVDRPPELNFKFKKGGDKTKYYNYGIK